MITRHGVEEPVGVPRAEPRLLVATLVFLALVVAVIGSLGAPLITAVSQQYGVSLAAAQWTLTVALLSGAVATPVLGRLGAGPKRRHVVLVTLAVVAVGSAMTVLPLPFLGLLVGRAAQGVGLGLTALMMATARDHLPAARATSTIALLSVASTAGVGLGYPVAGLLTDLGGTRAAYGLGLVITVAALIAAAVVLPAAPERARDRLDVRGAVLLTVALLLLLGVLSQTGLWRHHEILAAAGLLTALGLLAGWFRLEARTAAPLVDVRLLRHPAVAAANLVMLTGGVGMYLLLALITRYVQTPPSAAYGFGLSTFEAGLVLVPFSVLGFITGRLVPVLRRRLTAHQVLTTGTVLVLGALTLFATLREPLAAPVVAMGLLGAGVGAFSAAMPAVILAATPQSETASAMSVNGVVRTVGFSLGSALGGLVLSGYTSEHVYPDQTGYTVAASVGIATTLATLLILQLRAHREAPAPS